MSIMWNILSYKAQNNFLKNRLKEEILKEIYNNWGKLKERISVLFINGLLFQMIILK
jgi:hypothetical protein